MTQAEFAKQAGLSAASWWQILNGRRNLGWRNAKKVAALIGGDPNLWREGADIKERLDAWDAFCGRTAKA